MSTHRSLLKTVVTTLIVVGACASGWAAVPSTFYTKGKPVPLVDSYACTQPDILNQGKSVLIVAFTDAPIDKAAANAADDPCREVVHQYPKKFANLVELKLKYDGSVYNIQTFDANGTSSRSGDGMLKLVRNDGKHIEGSFVSRDASKKKAPDGAFFDLHFALDIAGASGR